MLDFGFSEILLTSAIALVVLGPERLPKAARQLGSAWRELTKLRDKLEAEVRSAMPDLDLPKIPALPARGLTGYLGGMMLSGSGSAGAASAGAATAIVAASAAAILNISGSVVETCARQRSRYALRSALVMWLRWPLQIGNDL